MYQTAPRETILVTGTAGFIGMHVCQKFLDLVYAVVGIDNLNSYYDVALKNARVDILTKRNGFRFERSEIAEAQAVKEVFANSKPDYVLRPTAQTGVRYSIDHPQPYIDSNFQGFQNILENYRHFGARHLFVDQGKKQKEQMGSSSRALVEQRFDEKIVIDEYLDRLAAGSVNI